MTTISFLRALKSKENKVPKEEGFALSVATQIMDKPLFVPILHHMAGYLLIINLI